MKIELDKIEAQLLKSYKEIGVINHISKQNLPSREVIASILSGLESLIFPGFETHDKLEEEYISYTVGEKVNRIAGQLISEIARARYYDCKMNKKNCRHDCREKASAITNNFLLKLPILRELALEDIKASFEGDPAAKSFEEIILSYPGLEAITCHRISNMLLKLDVPLIPRMMSEFIHKKTGIDIHPGAEIGKSFFIDHGTAVVIGETTKIGRNVKLYQGVTLGALSVKKEEANVKRHPTIEDDVTIYAGATILGGQTTIGKGSIIGGNVWITSSIPSNSLVYNKPADYVLKNRYKK